jgi:hypothetical protein
MQQTPRRNDAWMQQQQQQQQLQQQQQIQQQRSLRGRDEEMLMQQQMINEYSPMAEDLNFNRMNPQDDYNQNNMYNPEEVAMVCIFNFGSFCKPLNEL